MIAVETCVGSCARNLRLVDGCFSHCFKGRIIYRQKVDQHTQRRTCFRTYNSQAPYREESAKVLSSPNNAYVKHCSKLRINSKYRLEQRAAVLAGVIPVLELSREVPNLDIKTLLWSGPQGTVPGELRQVQRLQVTDEILKKVSGLQTVNGLLAAAEIGLPREADFASLPRGKLNRLLVLDGVQDPGNLGTLLRTAVALGWQGVFLLEGCCDPYNDKALRASRGATFKLPIEFGSWMKLDAAMKHHNMVCYGADSHTHTGELPLKTQQRDNRQRKQQDKPLALVLGSEGQGLSDIARNNTKAISIPMTGTMESLCVSQAGAILLFLLGEGSPYSISGPDGSTTPDADFDW